MTGRRYVRPALLAAAVELLGPDGKGVVLDVTGDSMVPTLRSGDAVRVALGRGRMRFGDVLVFVQADSVVVHRYLGPARDRAGRPCLRTRGDGRSNLDPALDPGHVLGRVVSVRRDGAWWSLEGAGARSYGAAAAVHDLFWAAAALVGPRGWALRLDRALLRRADALLFRALHVRAAAPAFPDPPQAR